MWQALDVIVLHSLACMGSLRYVHAELRTGAIDTARFLFGVHTQSSTFKVKLPVPQLQLYCMLYGYWFIQLTGYVWRLALIHCVQL